MKANPIDRFMSHVDTSGGPDDCHPWTASRNDKGYGWFRLDRRTWLAHRWLAGYQRGAPLTRGEVTCHSCDNPPCCNPRHLRVGTQAENIREAWRKGRGHTVMADLNAAKVRCIRGHPFDAANTYITPDGRRQCRSCKQRTTRRSRAKRDASVRTPP